MIVVGPATVTASRFRAFALRAIAAQLFFISFSSYSNQLPGNAGGLQKELSLSHNLAVIGELVARTAAT
jgi:hypothetical protein